MAKTSQGQTRKAISKPAVEAQIRDGFLSLSGAPDHTAVVAIAKGLRIDQAATLTIFHFAYGYWITPAGELIEVEPYGHARKARAIGRRYRVTFDDRFLGEDKYRIPFIEAGAVRIACRGTRLIVQCVFLSATTAPVVKELARIYHRDGGDISVDLFGAEPAINVTSKQDRPFSDFLRRLRVAAGKAKQMPFAGGSLQADK